jgi:hypothetical protein
VTNKSIKTSFFASGFVATTAGASATLVLSVNGKNTVVNFPPGSERDFVQKLDYYAKSTSEIRVTAFLLAEQESGDAEASAFLGVNTIETDTALAKRKAAGEKRK